jgi:Ca-activated chloride channel family protein
MYFEFENIYYFLLLPLISCIYLCPITTEKKYFVHLHLFSKFKKFIDKDKLIFSIILISIITALASPITYAQKSPNNRKGRDLVIVLDTSGSMGESGYDNEQIDKRKFDSLKEMLKDFILKRYDDNIGVVVFGTFAYATAPLTYDREALNYVLDFVDVGIAGDNTAIGDGLAQAFRVLKYGDAKKKVILLLSDGYQNSGSLSVKDAVELASKSGVKIYTVGVGKKGEYDKELLDIIAKSSKAKFFTAKDASELKDVYKAIDRLEPSPIRSQHYLHKNLLFDIPLFIAIALLIVILIKRERTHL